MATTVYEREIGAGGVGVRICIKSSNGGYQVAGRLAVRNNDREPDFRETETNPTVSDFHVGELYKKKSEI